MIIWKIVECKVSEPIKYCPTIMIAAPTVQRIREPKRSDKRPATGANTMITTEPPIKIQPICVGVKPMRFCK